MTTGPMQWPKPTVIVEYDCRDGRTEKTFNDAFAAKRFYAAKAKEGKNPKLKKVEV